MYKFFLPLIAILMATGCLEAQPAPNIAMRNSDEFTVRTLAEGFSVPWAASVLPSGAYLLTERAGKLWYISGGHKFELTGLPDDIYVNEQGGLFDITYGPDFHDTGYIFLSYAFGTHRENGTALYRARLDGRTLADGKVIYKTPRAKNTSAHFGGALTALPDGTLLMSIGDGFTFREAAQQGSLPFGKIIRIDQNGDVPPDNPFLGQTDILPETFTLGHRNIQGLYYDVSTGNIWASEHGPRGGDELNLIKAGANYGWPIATTGRDYNGARISPYDKYDGLMPYIYDWVPSIAPAGLIIYRGTLFSDWQGDALISALAGRSLRRLDLNDTEGLEEEALLTDMHLRIRDVAEDLDGGVLLAAEDDGKGYLIKLTPINE